MLSFHDPATAASYFAENAVIEIPCLASVGIQARYVGRPAIEDFVQNVLDLYPDWAFHDEEITVLIDMPDQVFAKYVVHPTGGGDGPTDQSPLHGPLRGARRADHRSAGGARLWPPPRC